MSESLLFGELLDHVRAMIDERLARFRADLSRSTGVLPPTQLPGGGNTGGGYSPSAHAATHAAGGDDELTPAAIGAVSDDDSRLSDARTPTAHASSHQHGGGDEIATATPGANAIPKAGSGGTIADGWLSFAIARVADLTWSNITGKPSTFAPSAHASSHQHGGSDEVATATPGANAIPKAGSGGTIADGWLSSLIARVADIVTHAAVKDGVHGLANAGGYTLTVPATGTAALRASAATAGRVGFWSGAESLSHDSNLFWDAVNKYFGIGTSSPTTILHLHSTTIPQMLVLSSFAPGFEFRDNAVQASRTCAGFFGYSTADGNYSASKGDLNFITSSYASGVTGDMNFSTPDNNSGGYSRKFIMRAGGAFLIKDGITAPSATSGFATIYVDSADGDLKVKFGDGTVKTIVTDT